VTAKPADKTRAIKVFLIATEESGDRLGSALMRAVRDMTGGRANFSGVGGRGMREEGLASLFPIDSLSILGLPGIARQLPSILRNILRASEAVLRERPDVLVLIDGPDFTHRVARRVRRRDPSIPILDYVSPSVWAWRPWRAKAMRTYVDRVLAILPFEPDVHRRLGGPPCEYVGHPLIERLDVLRPDAEEEKRRSAEPPLLLVLPGSRRSEVRLLMPDFGAALGRVAATGAAFELVLPTPPHLAQMVEELATGWPVKPRIVTIEKEKLAAFRVARAALVKSGTVTLELALAGVPMIAAYRLRFIEALIAKLLLRVETVILANLVIGEKIVPEFLQYDCTPERLSAALIDILRDGAARDRQVAAFARLDAIMETGARFPSARAAAAVIAAAGGGAPVSP
jgi:lipid-A-disaccharide synthase